MFVIHESAHTSKLELEGYGGFDRVKGRLLTFVLKIVYGVIL